MAQEDTFVYATDSLTVFGQNVKLLDLFNSAASTKVLKILSVRLSSREPGTPYGGSQFHVHLNRTTSVGTGGVVQSAKSYDTNQPPMSPNIMARALPTGGAALSDLVATSSMYHASAPTSEPISHYLYKFGGADPEKPLTLRAGQGLVIRHVTSANGILPRIAVEVLFTVV